LVALQEVVSMTGIAPSVRGSQFLKHKLCRGSDVYELVCVVEFANSSTSAQSDYF
jgi:hypothetical protein